MTEINLRKLEALLRKMADEDKFSGVALVHKNGEIVFEGAYGFACKRFSVPNTIETKFNIGSLNKLITKTAILQLLQRGLLDLDDLVGKYLPDFPKDIAEKVKIRHLISFTSGMGDYFNERFASAIGRLRKLDDFVELFIDDPLLFEPGEKKHYSNAGYVVLGKIIEAVSGMDYFDYIRENIYKPAGMDNSDHYELDSPTPNRATGYTRNSACCESIETGRRNNFYLIGTRGSPAGGGYSTVRDLMKFDIAVDNEKLLDGRHSKMVMRPIGSSLDTKPKSAVLAGGAPGLIALYFKFFEFGHSVFVLSNYDPEDVEPMVTPIRSLFLPDEDKGKIVTMRKDE
ncbi:MAG: serine hydrolase domain-containing protein [Candidatus Thorarchaeota archaeon]|jgi:CubicO group peptidase (beta-lactamase class C family)